MQFQFIKSSQIFLIALSLLWLLASLEGNTPNAQAQGGGDIFVFDKTIDLTGPGANAIALGDMDGDGDLDAYLGLKDGFSNKTYLNNNGTFVDSGQSSHQDSTLAVKLADFDNNGTLDAFVGNANGDVDLVEKNVGRATQEIFPLIGTHRHDTYAVDLGDIDNDGDIDALIATSNYSQLWINQAGAFFEGQTLSTGVGTDAILLDIDDDTDLDAVVLTNFNQTLQVWLNTSGTFSAGASLPFEPGGGATDLAVGLINSDTLPDLYLVRPQSTDLIALNNGFNSFNQGQQLPIGNSQDVVLSDIDGDGDVDAVVAVWEYGNSGDQVWLNNNGTFSQAQVLANSRSVGLAVGDANGDFSFDVLLANLEGSKKLWRNQLAINASDLSVTFHNPEDVVHTFDFPPRFGIIDQVNWTYGISITAQIEDASNVVATRMYHSSVVSGSLSHWLTPCNTATSDCLIGTVTAGSTIQGQTNFVFQAAEVPDKYYNFVTMSVRVNSDKFDPNPDNNLASRSSHLYTCWLATCFLEAFFCDLPQYASQSSIQVASQSTQIVPFIPLYYQIRDDILAPTEAGQHYSNLYYTHDAELQSLILNDNGLFNEALYVLEQWQSNLQALLEGQGDSTIITSSQISAVSSFLTSLSIASSPTLQQVIAEELARLGPLEDFEGITMSEAKVKVVGNAAPGNATVYLPLIIK